MRVDCNRIKGKKSKSVIHRIRARLCCPSWHLEFLADVSAIFDSLSLLRSNHSHHILPHHKGNDYCPSGYFFLANHFAHDNDSDHDFMGCKGSPHRRSQNGPSMVGESFEPFETGADIEMRFQQHPRIFRPQSLKSGTSYIKVNNIQNFIIGLSFFFVATLVIIFISYF